jgi:GntR family transcriptional regulator
VKRPRISIDVASHTPAYRQIADSIRVLFVDGELPPGSELPSVRRLAIELGVHFNTVAEAYRTLADEGWLDVSHGRSARVAERRLSAATDAATIESFRQKLERLVAEMRSQGLSVKRIAAELRKLQEGLRP